MKKVLIILSLFLLVGCTSKLEDEKIAYLEYKSDLEKQEEFTDNSSLEYNIFFNIERENEEQVNYKLTINNPKINMHDVKALLIHDYSSEEAFPSVGIFDEGVTLDKDSDESISLEGNIISSKDIGDVKFKLYLEYKDDNNEENKIYYEVQRG